MSGGLLTQLLPRFCENHVGKVVVDSRERFWYILNLNLNSCVLFQNHGLASLGIGNGSRCKYGVIGTVTQYSVVSTHFQVQSISMQTPWDGALPRPNNGPHTWPIYSQLEETGE